MILNRIHETEWLNRRKYPRFDVCIAAEIEPLDESAAESRPIKVVIRDISMTGLLMCTNEPIKPGSTWRLWALDDRNLLTSLPIMVRHAFADPIGFTKVGVQVMLEPFFLTWLGVQSDDLYQPTRKPHTTGNPPEDRKRQSA